METAILKQQSVSEAFTKTPVPLSKSPATSPSIRSMTQTVIVSLAETVTHDITYGEFLVLFTAQHVGMQIEHVWRGRDGCLLLIP